MRTLPEVPLHVLGYTRRILRALERAPDGLKASLRWPSHSSHGRRGYGPGRRSIYPLPLPQECREAMAMLVTPVAKQKQLGQRIWTVCERAWWGLLIIGLNSSQGFTSEEGCPANPMQEKVLALLASDAADFVKGDGLGEVGVRGKFPEVPWSKRLGDLSLSYVGEILEKARWLTWEQVEPGLPPVGRGGSLDSVSFCDNWVAKHLLNPQLTRICDDEVGDSLPHAVVRCTQEGLLCNP